MDRGSRFKHFNEQEILEVITATMVLKKLPLRDRTRTHCWRLTCHVQSEYLAHGMKLYYKGGYQFNKTNKKGWRYHLEKREMIDLIASKILIRYPQFVYLFTAYFNDTATTR